MFWFNDEVSEIERRVLPPHNDKKRLVMYGSSSIRMWPNYESVFSDFEVVNRGFGGSTIAACCCYFHRLIPSIRPDVMLFYAGDNDLGSGRHPEELLYAFKVLVEYTRECCGNIPIGVVSIKPSFAHEERYFSIKYSNRIIKKEIETKYPNCMYIDVFNEMRAKNRVDKSLFEEDGLHMTEKGYAIWNRIVNEQFVNKVL